ncbi:MAG TPA: aminoacyl-tRNA hydrolase [Methylococcus sp.]|nr:aminoacyl-tRNA hydrolase [Methylococcus sp.]
MFQLLVGLGNPGPAYDKTRHNVGFWFVDRVASCHDCTWKEEPRFRAWVTTIRTEGEVRLMKPLTYMNRSGIAVAAMAAYYKIPPENLLVAHDDLDFEPGLVRLKRGGGHGGHNGLRDIVTHLGTGGFARLRFGIGRPPRAMAAADYVLAPPPSPEREAIMGAIERVMECLPELLQGKLESVMNRLHV